MNRGRPGTRLLLAGTVAASLICLASDPRSTLRASTGSPAHRSGIVERPAPAAEGMIDVGGRRLHCFAFGDGPPTVVLISGLETPQEYWNPVIPDLAARTKVVTFDRAGIGKSEIGHLPTHGEQSARDLRVLLDRLRVPRPYIVVGHSYGGNVARLFASMYPDDIGGLILEETQHEDILTEMRKVLKGRDLETFERVLVAGFEAPAHPRTESDYRNATRGQVKKSRPPPRIPFVILTCADRARALQPMFSDQAIEEIARVDSALMEALAASIPGGRQIMIQGTGHNVHVDKPQALIAPVLEMIEAVQNERRD